MQAKKLRQFNDVKAELTERDIEDILSVIGYRCRAKTVNRMRSILTYSPQAIPNYGILNRLSDDGYGWGYCAGQSYPDEIRTVRDIILGK